MVSVVQNKNLVSFKGQRPGAGEGSIVSSGEQLHCKNAVAEGDRGLAAIPQRERNLGVLVMLLSVCRLAFTCPFCQRASSSQIADLVPIDGPWLESWQIPFHPDEVRRRHWRGP